MKMLLWMEIKSHPRASPCPGAAVGITRVVSVGVRGEFLFLVKNGFGVCAVVAPGSFL